MASRAVLSRSESSTARLRRTHALSEPRGKSARALLAPEVRKDESQLLQREQKLVLVHAILLLRVLGALRPGRTVTARNARGSREPARCRTWKPSTLSSSFATPSSSFSLRDQKVCRHRRTRPSSQQRWYLR